MCILNASPPVSLPKKRKKTITTPKSNRLNVSLSFSAACSHKLAKPTISLETGNVSSLRFPDSSLFVA